LVAVAGGAELQFRLDRVLGERRQRDRETERHPGYHRKDACEHDDPSSRRAVYGKMWQDIRRRSERIIGKESLMREKVILALVAAAAAMVFPPVVQSAENQPALTGVVSSQAEAKMEAVVVTPHQSRSIVQPTLLPTAHWRYSSPPPRLKPAKSPPAIRAVGYALDSPAKATVAPDKAATADIRLKKTKNLAGQLTNAEWMMSIPGTEEQ